MNIIQNQTFDQERAFYGSNDTLVQDCAFDGPADGEIIRNIPEGTGTIVMTRKSASDVDCA